MGLRKPMDALPWVFKGLACGVCALTMRHAFGRAAATTLGFIGGNFPGAYKAYRAYGKFMPPVKKRGRSRVSFRAGTKRRRTGSVAPRSRSVSRSGYGRGFTRRSGVGRKTFARRGVSSTRSTSRTSGTSGAFSAGDDATRSVHKFRPQGRKAFLRGWKKLLGPRYLLSTARTRVSSLDGRQNAVSLNTYYSTAAGTVFGILERSDLTDMFNNLAVDEVLPIAPPDSQQTRRMLVEFVAVQFTIRSATTGPVEVTIYDIELKRDQSTTLLDPASVWRVGIDTDERDPGSSTALVQADDHPGSTPFQSQRFVQYYNVTKVTKVMIHPGSTHKHSLYIPVNRVISREMLQYDARFRRLTKQVMMVVKGPIVQERILPFGVTYGAAEVDIIADYRAKFRSVEKSRTIWTAFTELPTTLSSRGQVLEDQDVVATETTVGGL